MTDTATAMPSPDPALRQFQRFIGTWEMKGRTLDSDVDNVVGAATYTWLPGGFFLEQRTEINFTGYESRASRSSATTQRAESRASLSWQVDHHLDDPRAPAAEAA